MLTKHNGKPAERTRGKWLSIMLALTLVFSFIPISPVSGISKALADENTALETPDAEPLSGDTYDDILQPSESTAVEFTSVYKYIKDNADTTLVGNMNERFKLADMASTLVNVVDGTKVSHDICTIEGLWGNNKIDFASQGLIAFTKGFTYLYDVGDGDWLVGEINGGITNAEYRDFQATWTNIEQAEMLGEHFKIDGEKGLMYVEKSLIPYTSEDFVPMTLRAQILYRTLGTPEESTAKIRTKVDTSMVSCSLAGESESGLSLFAVNTNILLQHKDGTKITSDMIDKVYIDGVEVPADLEIWTFNEDTGVLTVDEPPVDLSTVEIEMSDSFQKMFSRITEDFSSAFVQKANALPSADPNMNNREYYAGDNVVWQLIPKGDIGGEGGAANFQPSFLVSLSANTNDKITNASSYMSDFANKSGAYQYIKGSQIETLTHQDWWGSEKTEEDHQTYIKTALGKWGLRWDTSAGPVEHIAVLTGNVGETTPPDADSYPWGETPDRQYYYITNANRAIAWDAQCVTAEDGQTVSITGGSTYLNCNHAASPGSISSLITNGVIGAQFTLLHTEKVGNDTIGYFGVVSGNAINNSNDGGKWWVPSADSGSWQASVGLYKVKLATPSGTINLIKKSDNPSSTKSLAGAKYEVLVAETEVRTVTDGTAQSAVPEAATKYVHYAEMTTAADGTAKLTNVPVGKYQIKEISAPSGFGLDTEVHAAEITSQNPNASVDVISIDPEPVIEVEKTVDQTLFNVSDTATYTLDVWTPGNTSLTNAGLVDELPAPLTGAMFDTDAAQLTYDGKAIQGNITVSGNKLTVATTQTLEPNKHMKLVIPVTLGDTTSKELAGTHTNKVTGTGNYNKEVLTDTDTVTIEVILPELTTEKSAEKSVVSTSEVNHYTAKTTNTGHEASIAFNVAIHDALDSACVDAGAYIAPETIVVKDPAGEVIENAVVTWTGDPVRPSGYSIATNANLSYDESITVEYDVIAGETTSAKLYDTGIDNVVYSTSDNSEDSNEDYVHVDLYPPVLTIDKTSDIDTVMLNEKVNYTVKVNQTEEQAIAWNVSVTDSMSEATIAAGAWIDKGTVKVVDPKLGDITEQCVITYTGVNPDKPTGYIAKTPCDLEVGEPMVITYSATAGELTSTGLIDSSIYNVAEAVADNILDPVSDDNIVKVIPNTKGVASLLKSENPQNPQNPSTPIQQAGDVAPIGIGFMGAGALIVALMVLIRRRIMK